jgi:hypothetical protein
LIESWLGTPGDYQNGNILRLLLLILSHESCTQHDEILMCPLIFVELFTDSVFLVGIGWYFLGILPINTKGKLGWYILLSEFWGHNTSSYSG